MSSAATMLPASSEQMEVGWMLVQSMAFQYEPSAGLTTWTLSPSETSSASPPAVL